MPAGSWTRQFPEVFAPGESTSDNYRNFFQPPPEGVHKLNLTRRHREHKEIKHAMEKVFSIARRGTSLGIQERDYVYRPGAHDKG